MYIRVIPWPPPPISLLACWNSNISMGNINKNKLFKFNPCSTDMRCRWLCSWYVQLICRKPWIYTILVVLCGASYMSTLRSSNMAGWESPNNWGFHGNIIYKWGLSIAMFDYWRLVGCLVTFWKRFYHWKSMCASWKLHIMAIMVKQSSGNATENHHWHNR